MPQPVVVNMHEAKTHFSRLVARALAGESVVIARDGQPVCQLTPLRPPAPRRVLGAERGRVRITPGFDAADPDLQERLYT
jgi:antitoxin (DNA-binding transcriptional repressor) of toxin-antitoxin stability system